MDLYLIRHGIAVDLESITPADKDVSAQSAIDRDEQRFLTKRGRKKIGQVADRLARLDVTFDLIVTSPLLRAHQTAEILLERQLSAQLEVAEDLKPIGNLPAWLMWWQAHTIRPISTLALVGHEPNLSHWAELLIFGKVVNRLALKKGGIIGLKFADDRLAMGSGKLECLMSPKYLLDGQS